MDYQIRCGEVTDRVERVVSRVVGEDIRTGRKLEEMTGGIIEDYRGISGGLGRMVNEGKKEMGGKRRRMKTKKRR